MENNCALDRMELEMLSEQFPDEALESAVTACADKKDKITLYYCTALYFCPGP